MEAEEIYSSDLIYKVKTTDGTLRTFVVGKNCKNVVISAEKMKAVIVYKLPTKYGKNYYNETEHIPTANIVSIRILSKSEE